MKNKQADLKLEIRQMQLNMLGYLQTHWKLFAAEGVFFIVLGTIAIIVPHVFTLAIALFLGWLLLMAGIFQIIRALSMINMPGFNLWFLIGLLQTVIGYFLVTEPSEGAMTLTMLLTIFFAIEGIAKISLAFMMRPLARWNWVLFGGATSLLLAIIILMNWPGTALWVLGLLVGINMIFLGWTLLSISLHHKTSE